MKQATILISFILFLPLFSLGQKAVLSTDMTRVLYKGWENRISIAVPGYSCNDLEIHSATCKIEGNGCSYLVTPDTTGSIAVFIVRSKKSNCTVDTIIVPVKWIPDPIVKVAWGKEGKGSLIKDGPVIVGQDCSFPDSFFHIAEFLVTIYHGDQKMYEHKTIGQHFEAETWAAFEKAVPGDKLFLEEIRVIGPDNRWRLFNPVVYQFK